MTLHLSTSLRSRLADSIRAACPDRRESSGWLKAATQAIIRPMYSSGREACIFEGRTCASQARPFLPIPRSIWIHLSNHKAWLTGCGETNAVCSYCERSIRSIDDPTNYKPVPKSVDSPNLIRVVNLIVDPVYVAHHHDGNWWNSILNRLRVCCRGRQRRDGCDGERSRDGK